MSSTRTAIFLINLVQDVNVLRPIVFMATRDFGFRGLLLVSSKLTGRDLFGIWQNEIEALCHEVGADLEWFSNDWEAHRHLTGEGLIFAASESHLVNHVTTHSVFRHAPSGFIRVTLQHGFECVGFRHSADHVRAHGPTASFGADIVCSWCDADRLSSMAPSQRAKLLVTGPSTVLQMRTDEVERLPNAPGIVCENLHSVRLNGVRDFKGEFVGIFGDFCERMQKEGKEVVLRPHPGGQYVLKNKVALPSNARIDNAPMYRLDMRQFAYGISAPSSVLIDMVLAGIPTAVWRDRNGDMDADNYAGLTTVSSPEEWVEFARAAASDPKPFLELQKTFLEGQGMLLEPDEVYSRFAELFRAARRMKIRPEGFVAERERILFVANTNVPTLQLSFEKPLGALVGRGEVTTGLLTEQRIRREIGSDGDSAVGERRINDYLDRFDPSLIVFCRYSGPGHEHVLGWARRANVPVIYHIDDDLLAIPPDIGERKFAYHNSAERLATVRQLLESVDLVYASTEKLRQRLLTYRPDLPVIAGSVYCSGQVLRRPEIKAPCKIGYMASADHAHNLHMVLPAIEQLLERNPNVQFELFGSIPMPAVLARFADRISTAPPIRNYAKFLSEFAHYEWDIGICPLTPIDFNMMKADTKWVEYTSVGAAVVASRGTVYDQSCDDGCGILANGVEEWLAGLELLVNDSTARLEMVTRAQEKLRRQYNLGRLRDQIFEIFEAARQFTATSSGNDEMKDSELCLTA
jgi:glycosyltransferase involved in cell wall biosynthesis